MPSEFRVSDRTVSKFFNSYAKNFNAIYGNHNNPFNRLVNTLLRRSMRTRYELSIQGCEPIVGKSVLDIGCGPGHYSIALAGKGAERVLGIDFAASMISLAKENALRGDVQTRCDFICADFLSLNLDGQFDYALAMGFMDYVAEPEKLVEKVLSVTRLRAFFSFPISGGFLAWQRKMRYRKKCELYLYTLGEVRRLFENKTYQKLEIREISRDFFITVHMQ